MAEHKPRHRRSRMSRPSRRPTRPPTHRPNSTDGPHGSSRSAPGFAMRGCPPGRSPGSCCSIHCGGCSGSGCSSSTSSPCPWPSCWSAAGRPGIGCACRPGSSSGCCSWSPWRSVASRSGANPSGTTRRLGASRLDSYLFRLLGYVALTVLLVYAGNLDTRELSQRRLVRLLAWLFAVTVAGGLLGIVAAALRVHLAGRVPAAGRTSAPTASCSRWCTRPRRRS